MFRNRRTSQKPSDELYKSFKDNFPELGQALSTATTAPGADGPEVPLRPASADNAPTSATDMKDQDPTPRPHNANEQWPFGPSGLTPSFMDPHTGNFSMFAQLPGYYTPTPNGTSTLYHNQAGDLHTPTLGAALNTPLSLPTSESIMHAGQHNAFHNPQPHLTQQFQQQFHNLNPFQGHHDPHAHHAHQQHQAFAPHHFTHQGHFEHIDHALDSPMGELGVDVDLQHSQHASPEMLMHPHSFTKPRIPPARHPTGDNFRWHATLNAPTAMVKNHDEIPITYLNKGQAYTLNVVDTHSQPMSGPNRYRTFVRISFEDEQQRQRPSACWQLWKEGRGTNEAHQRGGRLQAVEYVPPSTTHAEDASKPRMELESASFDSFCVLWSPAAGSNECPISVRFNFLSTDFSHSKGVKGIPVRLCAKTTIIQGDNNQVSPEVCYCKVKLFRDHGAERKLSNDIAHVKKSIEKINQQIAQLDNGMPGSGKRKRSNSIAKGGMDVGRPGKVPKHRRTWSMSSITSSGARGSAEDDLTTKLVALQDMFTSTRPASVLYLKGAEEDDPDLHPVQLTGESLPTQDLQRIDSVDSATWDQQSQTAPSSSLVSPSPSNHSLIGSRRDSTMQQPTPFGGPSRVNSSDWRAQPQSAVSDIPRANIQLATPLEQQPIKVQVNSPTGAGWIEAIGIDATYQPPEPRAIVPVACFYIRPRLAGQAQPDRYHRAIYLMNRTLKDFTTAVAMKNHVEPTEIIRTVHYNKAGLEILFDDECIRELPEGQAMIVDFTEIGEAHERPGREWDMGDIQVDGDLPTIQNVQSSGYELKLIY